MTIRGHALGVHAVRISVGAHPAHRTLGVVELGRPGIGAGILIEEAVRDIDGDVAGLGQSQRRLRGIAATTEDQPSTMEEDHGRAGILPGRGLLDVKQQRLPVDFPVDHVPGELDVTQRHESLRGALGQRGARPGRDGGDSACEGGAVQQPTARQGRVS